MYSTVPSNTCLYNIELDWTVMLWLPIVFLPWFVFVCLFCCFTSQVNSYGHGGTVSSPNHTFFLGKLEQAVNQYFVHILSLVTDKNPSWMFQRMGGEWLQKLFHNKSPRKYGTGPGSNSWPLDLQSDSPLLPDMLLTALRGPVYFFYHGILRNNYRKITMKWSFSYNFFVKVSIYNTTHLTGSNSIDPKHALLRDCTEILSNSIKHPFRVIFLIKSKSISFWLFISLLFICEIRSISIG